MIVNPAVQHPVNAGAIVAPLVSMVTHAPEALTILLTCLGIVWYGVLFYDRFVRHRRSGYHGHHPHSPD